MAQSYMTNGGGVWRHPLIVILVTDTRDEQSALNEQRIVR